LVLLLRWVKKGGLKPHFFHATEEAAAAASSSFLCFAPAGEREGVRERGIEAMAHKGSVLPTMLY